jgi:hypothetical protein
MYMAMLYAVFINMYRWATHALVYGRRIMISFLASWSPANVLRREDSFIVTRKEQPSSLRFNILWIPNINDPHLLLCRLIIGHVQDQCFQLLEIGRPKTSNCGCCQHPGAKLSLA